MVDLGIDPRGQLRKIGALGDVSENLVFLLGHIQVTDCKLLAVIRVLGVLDLRTVCDAVQFLSFIDGLISQRMLLILRRGEER